MKYYSPAGNLEIWEEGKQPVGYVTIEEWQSTHSMPKPKPLTKEQLFENLRMARDIKLQETDKYFIEDFPISNTLKEQLKTYRQYLRDMPSQADAPWDGGGDNTPWPIKPEIN